MKGISAVLAMVLIVVITVAIIGLAYGWATGLFELTSEAGQQQVEGITESTQKSVDIVAAKCTGDEDNTKNTLTFSIKHVGTEDIIGGELTAFINEKDIDTRFATIIGDDIKETAIAVGDTNDFTYESGSIHEDAETITLKIVAPARGDEITLECPPVYASIPPQNGGGAN